MKVLFHGKVWLGVLSGKSQPPVFLSGESVFMKAPIKERFRAFVSEAKESIIGAFESVREAAKQPDKRKHFIVGALIAFVLGILIAPWVGFIAGCLAAILKEWWDSKGHGTVHGCPFHNSWFGIRNIVCRVRDLVVPPDNSVVSWQR